MKEQARLPRLPQPEDRKALQAREDAPRPVAIPHRVARPRHRHRLGQQRPPTLGREAARWGVVTGVPSFPVRPHVGGRLLEDLRRDRS